MVSWKVIKSVIDGTYTTEVFSSENDLLDFLEMEVGSYDKKGYCIYNGGSLSELIEQACRVGKEIVEDYCDTGIIEISKF